MKFKDTLLFSMLKAPKEEWDKGGVYRIILMIPYLLVVYTVGIMIALIIDFVDCNCFVK